MFLGRDANSKRIRKTETVRGKKSDAQRRLREILAELDRGITPTKIQYKVGEWLDKWLQEKIIPNRRQKTIDRYEGIIRLHIKPSLEHVGLVQLSPMHYRVWSPNSWTTGWRRRVCRQYTTYSAVP